MKVLSVQKYNYTKNKQLNFNAHPELVRIKSNYPQHYKLSCWFRHGLETFTSENYQKVVKWLSSMDWSSKNRMLIAGIGNSQEPFSHLAVIKNISKKPLKDVLDLRIVDLQDKPNKIKLYCQSFYDREKAPIYAFDSFVETQKYRKILGLNPKYKVNNEIFDFLKSTYNDSQKSLWGTPVQQAVKNYPDDFFNIISINNVFCYIKRDLIQPIINNITRISKHNGVVITDKSESISDMFLSQGFNKLEDGIFVKKIH